MARIKRSPYSRRGSRNRHAHESPLVRAHLDPRVVLYVRASTLDQVNTLDAQEYEGREWAAARDLEVAAVFVEPGVSGGSVFLEREHARHAVAFMEKHKIPTLLMLDQDRGFRDVVDLLQTVDSLIERGMCLRISSPDIIIFDPQTRLVATMLAAMGEYQLRNTKKQQKRATDQMRREGYALNQHARYGWDLGEEDPTRTSATGKPYRRLVPNEKEQAVLREIIAMYEAKETLQRIADTLNSRGIPTKRAGQTMIYQGRQKTISGLWKPQTVQSVIDHAELVDRSKQAEPATETETTDTTPQA